MGRATGAAGQSKMGKEAALPPAVRTKAVRYVAGSSGSVLAGGRRRQRLRLRLHLHKRQQLMWLLLRMATVRSPPQ